MQSEHYLRLRAAANALASLTHTKLPRTLCRRLFAGAEAVVDVTDFDGSLRMRLDLAEHMQRRIFWMGYYSRDVVATLKSLLRPGMRFVDVGANVGEISLIAAKLVGSKGQVISFEPVNAIADQLERHVRWNGFDWCRIERLALSDHTGMAEIYASTGNTDSKDRNAGLYSLHNVSQNVAPIQRIRLTTLDAYLHENAIDGVDGIKIDIEGAELECLRGAKATIAAFRPWLIVEVQQQTSAAAGYEPSAILQLLSDWGYQFYQSGSSRLHELRTTKLAAIQNVLCLHRERHADLIRDGHI